MYPLNTVYSNQSNYLGGWSRLRYAVKDLYGEVVFQKIRSLEGNYVKLAHLENNIKFLRKCKKHDIIPKGLRMDCIQKRFGNSRRLLRLQENMERKILKEMVILNYQNLQKLREVINDHSNIIKNKTSNLWEEIHLYLNATYRKCYEKISEKQIHKFQTLLKSKVDVILTLNPSPTTSTENIVNLSDKILSNDEEKLLKLGFNFALPYQNLANQMTKTMFAIEGKMETMTLDPTHKLLVRKGVTRIIDQEIKPSNLFVKWDNCISSAIKSLKRDQTIKIGKSDKGNSVVLMKTQDYNQKMIELLSNGPYTKLSSDPTKLFEIKITSTLSDLKEQGKLEERDFNLLCPKGSKCPLIYGAPKVHKPDVPLRPVVDYRNSPTYRLARFLASVLKFFACGQYTINTSSEFIKNIATKTIKKTFRMTSFDVKSLFTNIPISHGLEIVKSRLDENDCWKKATPLDSCDIVNLLKLCLECSYFQFNNSIYHQNEGSPMGSPVSPIFAEIVLQDLERVKIKPLIDSKVIDQYYRYVDDSFAIVQNRKILDILMELNSYHTSLQFTVEEEIEDKLPFLDTIIFRNHDGTFGHTVYRKPTFTNSYLRFNSFHPQAHKLGVIDTLFTRALRLCDDKNLDQEISYIFSILKSRGYPNKLLQERLTFVKKKEYSRSLKSYEQLQIEKEELLKRHRFILPWSGQVTKRIATFLRSSLDCEIGYYPGIKLGSILCNLKEKPNVESGCVYLIRCNTPSCNAVYIGETGRSLKDRLKEHQEDIRHNRYTKSATALHLSENPGHNIDVTSAIVLEREGWTYRRKVKESLYIRSLDNRMNNNFGTQIDNIWCSTLIPFYKKNLHETIIRTNMSISNFNPL